MLRTPLLVLLSGVALLATGTAGLASDSAAKYAGDARVNAPRTAAVASSGVVYFWADSSYQSVKLPSFDVGVQRDTATSFSGGPFESYNPRAAGYGVAGAVGTFLPYGTLPSAFGSNARVEIGGSYVNAKASQSGIGAGGGSPGLLFQLLDGNMSADANCGAGLCTTNSTLSTHYTAWNVNLKAASDYAFGAVMFTPSVIVFGGAAKNAQSFAQQTYNNGVLQFPYSVESSLRWTDWGARFGLDSKWNVTNAVTLGLGGNVGTARRSASLDANDICGCAGVTVYSAVSTSTTTAPLLANAEASVALKITPAATFKGFVGLNYDSRVPGISAQSHSGTVFVGKFGTPAGIKFSAETSFYAGGGLTVSF